MNETQAERRLMADAWGDRALVGSTWINGQYEAPGALAELIEGTLPTFTADRADLAAASVAHGTILDEIKLDDGTGPPGSVSWKVVSWTPVGDGTDVVLGLQSA